MGDSGTGKELVARLIHTLNPHEKDGALFILDCTTIVPTLSGIEFFGHEKGAFTGAVGARVGAFAMANNGTLFLDEVGELPLDLQAELLRVIQEGTYKRVGSNVWSRTRFRLVCATNRDLGELQRAGRFRSDLYYRIAGWTIRLPTLAERPGDVSELAAHFVREFMPKSPHTSIDETVNGLLDARHYPGNVRDLKHLIARICARHVGPGPITVGDVPEDERPSRPATVVGIEQRASLDDGVRAALMAGMSLREIGEAAKRAAINIALSEAQGSTRRAARRLGVTERALQLRRASPSRSMIRLDQKK
jgi:transcriptional regulator with GAF, ATPase, and Fis domain